MFRSTRTNSDKTSQSSTSKIQPKHVKVAIEDLDHSTNTLTSIDRWLQSVANILSTDYVPIDALGFSYDLKAVDKFNREEYVRCRRYTDKLVLPGREI